jgi:hypothetical protein
MKIILSGPPVVCYAGAVTLSLSPMHTALKPPRAAKIWAGRFPEIFMAVGEGTQIMLTLRPMYAAAGAA